MFRVNRARGQMVGGARTFLFKLGSFLFPIAAGVSGRSLPLHLAADRNVRAPALNRCARVLVLFLCSLGLACRAAVPPAERLLPDDTYALATAPDFANVRELYHKSPQYRCLSDPAMKAFTERFFAQWNRQWVEPIERELDLKIDDYTDLLQGQVTFAVTRNGWSGQGPLSSGLVFVADTKGRGGQLKKNLAGLRKKWLAAGKPVRTEQIGGFEFSVLLLSSSTLPPTLQKVLPLAMGAGESGAETNRLQTPQQTALVIGQAQSLLIAGNSVKLVENVVAKLSGGGYVPSLGETPAYQRDHLALFRDAPLYAWLDARVFAAILGREGPSREETSGTPGSVKAPTALQWMRATGLEGLTTIAATCHSSGDGTLLQLHLGLADTNRQSVFKLLAGEAKETAPPPFVPANAVKFRRWRLDGQKAWAVLEQAIRDLSPESANALNLVLNTAGEKAKLEYPGYDLRQTIITNLGDDIVTYEPPRRAGSPTNPASASSLFLIGSPNPDLLAVALKHLFIIFPEGDAAAERDFLGRKVFSVPLPTRSLFSPDTAPPGPPRTLHYAASGGYVALATDVSLLEDFLRRDESRPRALRDSLELAEAAPKAAGPGAGLFGYQNQSETMRAAFIDSRNHPATATNPTPSAPPLFLLPGSLSLAGPEQRLKDSLDYSLLPEFGQVAKYFSFSEFGGSAKADGLTFKWFYPTPPALRTSEAGKF
jgi:hypothetical protein